MNTNKNTSKTIVSSHKELLRIIQQSINQYNEIRLINLLITCEVDTAVLKGKNGIPTDLSTGTIVVDYPLIIDGVECEELVINNITFNKKVVFPITSKSKIGTLAFFDCFFNIA